MVSEALDSVILTCQSEACSVLHHHDQNICPFILFLFVFFFLTKSKCLGHLFFFSKMKINVKYEEKSCNLDGLINSLMD